MLNYNDSCTCNEDNEPSKFRYATVSANKHEIPRDYNSLQPYTVSRNYFPPTNNKLYSAKYILFRDAELLALFCVNFNAFNASTRLWTSIAALAIMR